MTKPRIRKIWIWGTAVMIVGGLAVTVSSLGFAFHADDLRPGETDRLFWVWVAGIVTSCVIAAVGLVLQCAAWFGAVVNTRKLENKARHRTLLVGGLISYIAGFITFPVAAVTGSGAVLWAGYSLATVIGLGVMIPYLVVGPDQTLTELRPISVPVATDPTLTRTP
jgi:hypothetical protein